MWVYMPRLPGFRTRIGVWKVVGWQHGSKYRGYPEIAMLTGVSVRLWDSWVVGLGMRRFGIFTGVIRMTDGA
jgi:hypothetical protein